MKKKIINFSDKLLDTIDDKKSFVVVGLDPEFNKIPLVFREHGNTSLNLKAAAKAIINFNKFIIDIASPLVCAVKPQAAFYEMYGIEGIRAFNSTVTYSKLKGMIVVEDAKRNDIGNTAKAYSSGHLGRTSLGNSIEKKAFDIDAITVNPYLGSDGIKPFLDDAIKWGKGIFILVKTSNPSSSEIQDVFLKNGNIRLYEHVALMVNNWGKGLLGERGYSSVGAVVGATFPNDADRLRKILSNSIFLVPGYGAQGGKGKDIVNCFNRKDGYGAIISASRSIMYPHGDNLGISVSAYEKLVKKAIDDMNNDINSSLKNFGILPW